MDLNELLFGHQGALIERSRAASQVARFRAEERAGYYAERILSMRQELGAQFPLMDHRALSMLYAPRVLHAVSHPCF